MARRGRSRQGTPTHQKGYSSILCVIEDVLMGIIFGIGLMAGSFGIGLGCWVMVRVSSRVRVG